MLSLCGMWILNAHSDISYTFCISHFNQTSIDINFGKFIYWSYCILHFDQTAALCVHFYRIITCTCILFQQSAMIIIYTCFLARYRKKENYTKPSVR